MNKKALLFSTPVCEYCEKAKDILENSGYEVNKIDITENKENFYLMRDYAGEDAKSVPQVVLQETAWEETYIGGYKDLVNYFNNGKEKI